MTEFEFWAVCDAAGVLFFTGVVYLGRVSKVERVEIVGLAGVLAFGTMLIAFMGVLGALALFGLVS